MTIHWKESYWAVFSCGTVYSGVYGISIVWVSRGNAYQLMGPCK